MGISPDQSKSGAGSAASALDASMRSSQRGILYRRCLWAALLAGVALISGNAGAQEERPQIMPGERKPTKKKDEGPRALGVLQMASNGKTSLVPIAILINGKFWDAGAYKADPVPMALYSGTVYEGERSGNSLGLFTVGSALHSNAANAQMPWLGTGNWSPVGMEPPAKAQKADTAPVGIDNTDGPPRLTRDTNASKPASPPSAPASPPSTSSGTQKPSSGDEPPRLSKGSSPPAETPASGQDKPASKDSIKPADTKADAKANIPASDSGASEANRPVLRRGRPAQSFADEEIPGYSKAGSTPSSAAAGKVVEPLAARADVKLVPAISDAAGPIPHSYAFEWLKDEEGDRRKQMLAAAKEQIQAYVLDRAKSKITQVPVHTPTSKRMAKPPEPILENVQMVAYDLWNSNQPIIIFSAEAHMPPPPAGTPHSEADTEMQYSVLLVAYPDIYNNLRKLYAGVTDKLHLDVTPRLDLIDAVDADGDGRGELLFRKTSDAGTGWIVYRATADKLWKMFDSLNPE
jgi:hypothetical protein